MSNNEDLRVVKTRLVIKQAFYELIFEKEFNKINVSDITTKARINRSTFYLHYQDKYALLTSLENEVLEDVSRFSCMIDLESIHNCYNNGLCFPHVLELLVYIKNNLAFFTVISEGNIGLPFFNKLGIIMNERLFALFPDIMNDPLTGKYVRTILVSIVSSTIHQWIRTNLIDKPEDVAIIISDAVYAVLASLESRETSI